MALPKRSVRESRASAPDVTVRVIMIGTDPAGRGGIASVATALLATPAFRGLDVRYVVSHSDGSAVHKVVIAVFGLLRFLSLRPGPQTVVHLHMSSRGSFFRKVLFIGIARAARAPIVIHLHSGAFDTYYHASCPVVQFVIRWALCLADVVVTLSGTWSRKVQAIAPVNRIEVIGNGVEIPHVPAPLPSLADGPVVFLGRLSREKGTFDLLQALAAVGSTRAVLAGDGDRLALFREAERLGIVDRIDLRSWTVGLEKAALLRSAVAFVLPSHAEGLPMALLEAMAMGLPIVATAVGGIPDVIEPERSGLLVPPADSVALAQAIKRLLDEPETRVRLGRAARSVARTTFAINDRACDLVAVYEALADCRARP
jgi:glycosyltransferase involved in cell wall biosynthesis